jgi:hypothetical protein
MNNINEPIIGHGVGLGWGEFIEILRVGLGLFVNPPLQYYYGITRGEIVGLLQLTGRFPILW